MEPASLPDAPAEPAVGHDDVIGKLSGTRRQFIRGIAATGASTAAVAALEGTGATALFSATAQAAGLRRGFADFRAIAASPADRFEVPEGFRADVLISWGDTFADDKGNEYEYGFNNDFLAYFPLARGREGILFVNHEYPGPFYQHGYKPEPAQVAEGKTQEEIEVERAAVGNSLVHVRLDDDDRWQVVSPSRYNRRIYGGEVPGVANAAASRFDVTGPLRGDPRVGNEISGSLGNCSGGITPWGTAISCEENFDGYGLPLTDGLDFAYGWVDEGGYEDYLPGPPYRRDDKPAYAKYGWVCEHDPYNPSLKPRKHTALGRFRHENTAYRAKRGARFVIYMGDDKTNEGVYKFVSDGRYRPNDRAGNLELLSSGTLYIARWAPEGRRRFATSGDTEPLTATSGTGTWVEVQEAELVDTATKLRERFGADFDSFFATNRPEDLEVAEDGSVYIAFTNNSTVRDVHGAVRRLVEDGDDPEAASFTWEDYAEGGPSGRGEPGEQGFSACDNLVFDKAGDLWVVTDISSGTLNDPGPLQYHANNALFYIPTTGPNAGIAYRFGNMPVEAEGTGPYFTPDERTLFVNVQHPGETSQEKGSPAIYGQPETYTSYWPEGNKTEGRTPALPRPSTVAITKPRRVAPGENLIPRPPDETAPAIDVRAPSRIGLRQFLREGLEVRVRSDEAARIRARLVGELPRRLWWRVGRRLPLGSDRVRLEQAGRATLVLRPGRRAAFVLRLLGRLDARLIVVARDEAGNEQRVGGDVRIRS